MLPVVSPPFVLSLSMIMLFGKAGIITRFLLGIYDNSVYGYWGIVIVQTLTFFPVCYMMLKGLLKNIDPSLEEAARDMGASRFKVFTSVTLPLMLPGLGNAFLVTFIESIADFANPMIIGGSYDTLATTSRAPQRWPSCCCASRLRCSPCRSTISRPRPPRR